MNFTEVKDFHTWILQHAQVCHKKAAWFEVEFCVCCVLYITTPQTFILKVLSKFCRQKSSLSILSVWAVFYISLHHRQYRQWTFLPAKFWQDFQNESARLGISIAKKFPMQILFIFKLVWKQNFCPSEISPMWSYVCSYIKIITLLCFFFFFSGLPAWCMMPLFAVYMNSTWCGACDFHHMIRNLQAARAYFPYKTIKKIAVNP